MENHFCDCPNTVCARHPRNHSGGCDPCIKDNLLKKKMPACLFRAVHDDEGELNRLTDYSIEGFVDYYQAHRDEYLSGKGK